MTVTKQLTVSSLNAHDLGHKLNDPQFVEHLTSDIIILLETWKVRSLKSEELNIPGSILFQKLVKREKARRYIGGIIFSIKKQFLKAFLIYNMP